VITQAGRTFLVAASVRLFRVARHARKRLKLREFEAPLPFNSPACDLHRLARHFFLFS
jgi:hypothetical protein